LFHIRKYRNSFFIFFLDEKNEAKKIKTEYISAIFICLFLNLSLISFSLTKKKQKVKACKVPLPLLAYS